MNSQSVELIPIIEHGTIQGHVQQLCDARNLHAFLGVRQIFAIWIKQRIAKYGFVEGVDYVCVEGLTISPNLANQTHIDEVLGTSASSVPRDGEGRGGDRRSIAYHLTIDMAKQLAMVQNNERGRQARLYFIERERLSYEVPANKEPPVNEAQAFFSTVRRIVVDRVAQVHCVSHDNRVRTFYWRDLSDTHTIITGDLNRLYEIRDGHVPLPWEGADLGCAFRLYPPAGCGVLFAGNSTGEPMLQDLFLLPSPKFVLVGTHDEVKEMLDADRLEFARIITGKQPRCAVNEVRY
ncbi:antA/AntB antirepressor family protein [Acidithiobacillus ferrooxidans]|uniref:antA/AntB antirepressor family protein n=1 Tax=Acidithiobacillus ferrooxidans TaxID=920 RepID=UPI00214CD060|nr:antA/AntB antirepressor family protein [Acidithiobacillus ferrooxidans]MCR2831327.1 antA/AntB antirepressor family protein [Acidithiobacillus ferrooxidans]